MRAYNSEFGAVKTVVVVLHAELYPPLFRSLISPSVTVFATFSEKDSAGLDRRTEKGQSARHLRWSAVLRDETVFGKPLRPLVDVRCRVTHLFPLRRVAANRDYERPE